MKGSPERDGVYTPSQRFELSIMPDCHKLREGNRIAMAWDMNEARSTTLRPKFVCVRYPLPCLEYGLLSDTARTRPNVRFEYVFADHWWPLNDRFSRLTGP